ncbi:MAG: adenylate/guanylate cyclase domain-containing protein [Cyanobacteria bacterium SIG26]|nr:adenylate/guanylate cyclase domain-containing protein [Cyanobacteria bacterium SIG26]
MKKLKNKWFYLNSFFIYLILIIVAIVLSVLFLETEIKAYFISNFTANMPAYSNGTKIVVLDEDTLAKYPKWNKDLYIELLDYFKTYAKPKVLGVDFIAPSIDPDNKSDMKFLELISSMDNYVSGFVPEKGDVDPELLDYMKLFEQKYSVNIVGSPYYSDTQYYKVSGVPEKYLNGVDNLASVVIKPEKDGGIIFSSINLIQIGETYYPSLPLRMYLYANNTNDIEINDYYIVVPKTKLKIPHKLIYGGVVKTDIRFYDNILFKTSQDDIIRSDFSHDVVSAYKIIDSYRNLKAGKPQPSDIPPEVFNDVAVFIGEYTSGPSSDFVKTPMSNRHPGVDVQATVYDNLVSNDFINNANLFINFFVLAIIAILTFIFIFRFSFIKSLLAVLILDVIFFIICALCARNAYILGFICPITAQLVTLIFGYSYKFITENRYKEKIKQAMGKYLSQDVMKNVVRNIDDLKLGGKRATVTVLFSDIRGFTSLSEKMSAEEVSMILNEYFAEMEPIITKYNGVINKFIGDAVMAIFGEPIQDLNHAQNAVKCAYEMLKKVEYLRDKWLFEGKPKIEIGVGINTGEVFIGNIGTETRMEYTVIGDTVNLASRIESYNKVYRTNLLVSCSTYEAIADIADVIKISEVQIRGKAKKMNIYEVLRIDLNKK